VSRQKLIIIIVNYDTLDYIKELIDNFLISLPRFPKIRIDWIIADAEDRFEVEEQKWQKEMKGEFKNKKANYFHFFKIPNRGFAHNVNLSYRLFRQRRGTEYKLEESDLLLILNPDTSLFWTNLEKAIQFMNGTPQAAVAGMALTGPSGQPEKWGHSITFPSLKLFFGRKRFSEPSLSDEPSLVAWISGGAMLVRDYWWRKLKGFDQDFYLYFEDVDFCRRTKEEGGEVYFLPQATVNHRRGGSGISIYRRKKHFYASEARYFYLYRSPTEYILLRFLRFPFKLFYFFRCYLVPSFWKTKIRKAKESIDSERQEGFPRFYSFLSSFIRIPFLKEIWLAVVIFNLILLAEAIWGKMYLSSPLILHYNAYLGIDLYGDTASLFTFPLLALLISLFNLALSAVLFLSKRYTPFVVLPAGISLAFQLTLSIAFLNLLMVNS